MTTRTLADVTDLLDEDEMALWVSWKRASDTVWTRVVAEITASTGLSAADFSVLTRVVEGARPLRQQELADALDWQRSRLSRQLTRMADRGLVERVVRGGTTVVRVTPAGRAVAKRARVAHARAVREALLELTPSTRTSAFWKTVRALAD